MTTPSIKAFIKLDGIDGQSTDDKHKGQIDVVDFSYGGAQPTVRASHGGARSGAGVAVDNFAFTHFIDKATPNLFKALCTGKPVAKVVFELCRSTGDSTPYLTVTMEDVLVAAIANGAMRDDSVVPAETVGLNYGKITIAYTETDPKTGAKGGKVEYSADVVAQKY
ncbi:MAG: type VI secretion system tube protein Hcp [Planctomycetes bacterium]|jgi:type VI secretion system secreted protein Hcp|nr:type VI secretion system tube protein Hcp [Planctomycetota bacterium]